MGTPIQFTAGSGGLLEGVRVVDLSRLVAGNMATHLFADHGADVIKIERPGKGDDLRAWRVDGVDVFWKVYGRNKRSMELDLQGPADRELLFDLIGTADALVENFVPGGLEKMGLSPQILLARNPNLVVLRISGWGQTGAWRQKPGFGTLIEAMSGWSYMNGPSDHPPSLPPLALADMVAGLYGAFALAAAIRAVERGQANGQVVDLSLFDAMLSFVGAEVAQVSVTGRATERIGSRSSVAAPRNIYVCADGGYVALSGSMQSMAERIFETIGRPDLKTDPRFADNTARVANNDLLDAIIGGFIAERTQAEALAIFEAANVTVGPVHSVADLFGHPYVAERQAIVDQIEPTAPKVAMHAITPRFSETPGGFRRPAPNLGEHTEEIRDELTARLGPVRPHRI